MPHEQHAVAIKEDDETFYGLATFAPNLLRPCPPSCPQAGVNSIPFKLYIHLKAVYIQESQCIWCIQSLGACNWCTIDPFAANEDNNSPDGNLFRGGVIQMIKMNRHPAFGHCSCQGNASVNECCWCLGTIATQDNPQGDAWQYPPTGCNGIAIQHDDPKLPEQFEGQLYRGGLFCAYYFGFYMWILFIGSAQCPKGCADPDSNYDSEGCGPDCTSGFGNDPECQCSVDWFMIYVKVNVIEPPHALGKPQGTYVKFLHGVPDSNGNLCGAFNTILPNTLIVDEEPEPHSP